MKYKQRILTAIVIILICIFTVLIYNNIQESLTVVSFSTSKICPVYNPRITAEWTVDAIYDDLNFTLNKPDGLYKVHEKSNQYKVEYEKPSEPLEIIVVPHSHNDPGWLWTFEDYYNIRTRQILTNTIKALQRFPDFRMIWTETVFLDRWWRESPEELRIAFKDLVLSGKIEILSGGWVSVDEATTHYGAVLDQLIEGHLWIKEHFGVFPNISWSIDPFGYSTTLPYLWRKSGMKDMAILRIHGAVKGYMGNRKMLTYKWRQPWDEQGKHDIMCHVEPFTLYNIECSCGPDTQVCKVLDFSNVGAFPESNDQEIHFGNRRKAESFHAFVKLVVEQYKKKAELYKHNVILMPHGDDFRYIEEYDFEVNYRNMKRLINYVNSKKDFNVKMKFGTVGDYFKALHSEMKKSTSKEVSLTGDFFTYTDKDNEYWSGYYTTRPFDKRMIRELFELLRTTETMTSLIYVYLVQTTHSNSFDWKDDWKIIQSARRTHGLLQHHDAITGTSAAATVIDFEIRMFKAINELTDLLQRRFTSMVTPGTKTNIPDWKMTRECISPIQPIRTKILQSTTDHISLGFINSYTRSRIEVVSIQIDTLDIIIFDNNNRKVQFQVSPLWSNYNSISNKGFEVNFEIKVPAVGFTVYKIKRRSVGQTKDRPNDLIAKVIGIVGTVSNTVSKVFRPDIRTVHPTRIFYIENKFLKISFLNANGALEHICFNSKPAYCIRAKINIYRFIGSNSNAYCFNVTGQGENLFSSVQSVTVTKGTHMSRVKVYHKLFTHTVTLYNTDSLQGRGIHIENNATLLSNDSNTELIMRLTTNIENKGIRYFTDSNGFQMVPRKFRKNLPVGANFYPFTTMAIMEDSDTRLTLHTGQPLGIGGLEMGSLDVILDRVPMSYGKGLDESVTDNKPAISKFILQAEWINVSFNNKEKYQMYPSTTSLVINDFLQNPIVTLYASTSTKIGMKEFSFLESDSLPCNIVFANFRTLLTEDARFIGTGLTLHKRAKTCGAREAKNICPDSKRLNIKEMFRHLELNTVKHMSLSHLFEVSRDDDKDIDTMELESFQIIWKS